MNLKKLKIYFAFFIAAFVCRTWAEKCKDISLSFGQQRFKIPKPMYWMQASGDCRVSYTDSAGISSMYNYCLKKVEDITSNIDAFPVPGSKGKIYVHPDHTVFCSTEEVIKSPRHTRCHFGDKELKGYYQSLGLIKSSQDGKSQIRILMGSIGRYRDYEIVQNNNTFEVKPLGPVHKACENISELKLERELPILSRDGTKFAFRDRNTRNTVIYSINPQGLCQKLPVEIPFETSKVAFTFGSESVDFLVYNSDTKTRRLLRMDLEGGKITAISAPDEDVTYMTTREDGKILYARRVKNLKGTFDNELVLLDQNVIQKNKNADHFKLIGYFWANTCNKDIDEEMALLVGQRVDVTSCHKLITQNRSSMPKESGEGKGFEALAVVCNAKTESQIKASELEGNIGR